MLTRKNDAALDFDFAKALEQSRDNPVFYVQYAHARAHSIFRTAREAGLADAPVSDLSPLDHPAELALAAKVAEWPRLVETAAKHHEPHRVAFYLYDLASDFHALWNRGKEEPAPALRPARGSAGHRRPPFPRARRGGCDFGRIGYPWRDPARRDALDVRGRGREQSGPGSRRKLRGAGRIAGAEPLWPTWPQMTTPPGRAAGASWPAQARCARRRSCGASASWGYGLLTRDAGQIPFLRAEEGPMKILPEDPGGLKLARSDMAVTRMISRRRAGRRKPRPRARDADGRGSPRPLPLRSRAGRRGRSGGRRPGTPSTRAVARVLAERASAPAAPMVPSSDLPTPPPPRP